MKIVVTGGAGFVGSCVVKSLNERGIFDIVIVDNIQSSGKWANIRNKIFSEYINKVDFINNLDSFKDYTHIIHMGACSSTLEKDFDYLYKNNFMYTKKLWNFCVENELCFLYASSAATYGDGTNGFSDYTDIKQHMPLNAYGYSKHLFDLWVQKQEVYPKQYVGLKFFNVYGPNEYFKNQMASMIFHGYNQIKETGTLKLFKSYNSKYLDGEQKRDFIYVKDVCKVINFFLDNCSLSGLFNVGTGQAESFNSLSKSLFKALKLEPRVEFVDMPQNLQKHYQYFTEAKIRKLSEIGYVGKFYSLEEGVNDYVINYLQNEYLIY